MVEDKAGRGFLDAQVLSEGVDGLHSSRLFLVSHLARDVPDQVRGQVQPLDDVLGGVGLRGDGELDVASDLAVAIACGAVDFTLGPALTAVLLSVSVFGVLAVEAPSIQILISPSKTIKSELIPLSVSRAVVHPAVAVAVEASGPALAVAVATGDAPRPPASVT